MTSYLFTSRQNPMLCMVSNDPSGESLPARWGPWDRSETPWDGQDAGLVAGVRALLEARERQAADDEDDAPSGYQ
jgi:hypothetical protein